MVAAAVAANAIRSARLRSPAGNVRMVPMDHGISMGPAPGLADPAAAVATVADHATCITVHKGLVRLVAPHADRVGVLMHLSASTDGAPDPHDKRVVGTVEEALRLGCDGVSVHVNVGASTEARQLQDVGRVATDCNAWGVPLMAMMYPRGPKVTDPTDPALVAHAARLGAELGADLVKVPYTGSADTFRTVVEGATVPVLVAGGPRRASPNDLLRDLQDAAAAGAAGVSIGRNVFQQQDPAAMLQQISRRFP